MGNAPANWDWRQEFEEKGVPTTRAQIPLKDLPAEASLYERPAPGHEDQPSPKSVDAWMVERMKLDQKFRSHVWERAGRELSWCLAAGLAEEVGRMPDLKAAWVKLQAAVIRYRDAVLKVGKKPPTADPKNVEARQEAVEARVELDRATLRLVGAARGDRGLEGLQELLALPPEFPGLEAQGREANG